jgi:hypothetical protein
MHASSDETTPQQAMIVTTTENIPDTQVVS